MSEPNFHLLDDPWLDCQLLDGSMVTLSLLEVAGQLGNIRELLGDWKPQQFALHRMLLAAFWRAHREDEVLQDEWDADRFDSWWLATHERFKEEPSDDALIAYFEAHRDRFALFGLTPFMQVANLSTDKGLHSDTRRLVPEFESDYFSLRAGNELDSISFAESARWLISIQAFDYSGIKSGALGDPRVKGGKGYPIGTGWSGMIGGVLIKGNSLAETLLLNTVPRQVFGSDSAGDLPAWEREPDTAAERLSPHPTGACDLLTWQSRRVRLFTDGDVVTGVLVSNGDQIPDAGANILIDPMTPYRYSSNKSKAGRTVYYPRPHDAERTIWRGMKPLLVREGIDLQLGKKDLPPLAPQTIQHLAALEDLELLDDSKGLDMELVSVVYGSQSSSIQDTVYAELALPPASFSNRDLRVANAIITASDATQSAAVALGSFSGQLTVAAGGEYQFGEAACNNLLDQLEPSFTSWMTKLTTENRDSALEYWFKLVRHAVLDSAGTLLTGAGARALVGREVDERFVSAGTAHQQLLFRLKEILPVSETQELPAS